MHLSGFDQSSSINNKSKDPTIYFEKLHDVFTVTNSKNASAILGMVEELYMKTG